MTEEGESEEIRGIVLYPRTHIRSCSRESRGSVSHCFLALALESVIKETSC